MKQETATSTRSVKHFPILINIYRINNKLYDWLRGEKLSEISTEEFSHEALESYAFRIKICLGEVNVLKILYNSIYLMLI